MNQDLKKYFFITIWVLSLLFFSLDIALKFADEWMSIAANYIYIFSLIYLFVDSNFLTEKVNKTEKFVQLNGYDVSGVMVMIILATAFSLYLGFKSSLIFIVAIGSLVISTWILIKYRKLITRPLIIRALVIGSISSLFQHNFLPSFLVILVLTPMLFISASLLNAKFPVTTININDGAYSKLIKSFGIGCLFGLPIALSNLANVITTNAYKWIDEFWKPILSFNAVLLEETIMRLFIITFIYALLISKTEKRIIPITAAVLTSSVFFGFSHFPHVDIDNCFNIVFLYGIPLGVLLYKRDFETVVGYHFATNFLGAISSYLTNS